MSTNRPNASIWDDDEGEAQLRPMMRKNNAHLFDDEPPVSSLSAASAASAAAAVAGYTASSAAEANAASALSAPSAYSVGSASSALSARSAGSAYSAASASSAAVPSAASAAAPEAADAAVSAPTPDSAGSAPLSTRSGATPDAAKPAVADAGATNPGSGAVRRRSLFTAVPQPVPVDEDSDDETIQVPVVREDLIPDSFSAASAVPTPESAVQADQADQEAVDSVQELNDAHEVEAAAVPLPTDFDAPSAISIPTPPHTVSSALSAESTFSIDSAVSAASAASSVGITLPSAATPAPAVPVTSAPTVPVTPAAGATDTASNELSKTTPTTDAPEPPAPPAPEQPEATKADFADDEVVASDHTETTIMDAADMELEEVVKPVVTSTSPVGVERLDHLATADSADLAPVAPSPSSAIFASTRTAAFSDSANQSDADNEVDDDVLLAGSTVVGKPASRAAAHWGGTLLALVLFPIAWFLMHTAANALTGALADGWPKVFSTAGIIELGMAIVLLIVVMATATRSSLGTFVTGITTLLIGLPFVVVPSITKQYLGDFLANMALQSRFGRILSEAILLDGVSGRLVIIGLFLIMLGVVSHSTRRAGRRERLVMDRANTKK